MCSVRQYCAEVFRYFITMARDESSTGANLSSLLAVSGAET